MTIDKLASAALLPLFLLLFAWTPASGAIPKITKVQVTESSMASQVEIIADAPVTYTYYAYSSPPRAVIDIALADPSQISHPLKIDSPLITGITLDRLEAPPIPLTRMTISLTHDAYLAVRSSPEDKGRLLVTLVKKMVQTPAAAPKDDVEKDLEAADKKPGQAATPTAGPKEDELDDLKVEKEAGAAAGEKAPLSTTGSVPATPLSPAAPAPAVTMKEDRSKVPGTPSPSKDKASSPQNQKTDLKPVVPAAGETKASPHLTITTTGAILTGFAPTTAPRVFRLAGPNRLVIDMPGRKGASQQREFPFDRLGIRKVRVGVYPDKVRFVFDAGQARFPAYRIEKSSSGLKVTFGK